jgi:hypothetical protein
MIEEKSVEQAVEVATGFQAESASFFLNGLVDIYIHTLNEISPWWSRQRDSELRAFWKDGQSASIVMGLAQNKLATIPIKVVPKDMSIAAHNRQAKTMNDRLMVNSEFGLGLHGVMLKFVEDYLGQDNGAFMEILGEGDPAGPIEGPVYGLRHLDSAHCLRTGDPVYPVYYTGEDHRQYKIHNARMIFMSQMPSSRREMFNVGFCSISRSLKIIENLHNVLNYQDEKMGARAASQILVGSGITGKEIIKTIAASEHMMNALGIKNLAKTIAIGSSTGDISLDRIELNDLKTFDEETTKTFAAYALAAAWGLEFQDLIPISGTRNSESISLQRARVRLPQAFMESFLQQANVKLVPNYLEVEMDFVDDTADQQRATIQDIDSRNFERQMSAGVTTPEVVQQIQYERGYIKRHQLRAMQLSRGRLEDGSPVQSIFFDKNYSDLLLLPPELLIVQENDPAVALEAININEVHIYSVVGSTSSGPIRDKANEALAALDWLKSEYRSAMMIAVQSQAPDDGQSEDGEDNPDTEDREEDEENPPSPTDGRQTNQERGEVGKATDFFRQNSQRFQENWLMKQDRPWNRFIKALETLFSKNK